MSRSLVTRKSLTDDSNWRAFFEDPFEKVTGYQHRVLQPLISQATEEETEALAGEFPNNITDCIWYSAGLDDEMPWALLCRLNTGAYAFFTAGYQCSGFTIVGDMYLRVSRDLAEIVQYAMSDYEYNRYLAETEIV